MKYLYYNGAVNKSIVNKVKILIECFLSAYKYYVCTIIIITFYTLFAVIFRKRLHKNSNIKYIRYILSRKQSVCQFYLCSLHVSSVRSFVRLLAFKAYVCMKVFFVCVLFLVQNRFHFS